MWAGMHLPTLGRTIGSMDETTFTSAQVLGIIERVAADEIARTTSTEEKLRVRRLAKKFVAEIRDQPRG